MKKKQAISLIVLVITIIVMIILAGTIILTLNNNGIIGKANEAVNKANEIEIKQLAELEWTEAYLVGGGKATQSQLYNAVRDGLAEKNIDLSAYELIVTMSGVTISKIPTLKELETIYEFKYYNTLSGAVNDANSGTTENADAEKQNAVAAIYTDNNGDTVVVLLKDIAETNALNVSTDMTINLGGHNIEFTAADAHLNINTAERITIDGRLVGSGIKKNVNSDTSNTQKIINSTGTDVTINGGTYFANCTYHVYCIYVLDANLKLNGCNIISESAQGAASVMARGDAALENCIITTNARTTWSYGARLTGNANVTNCTITTTGVGQGVEVYGLALSANAAVTNCTIKSDGYGDVLEEGGWKIHGVCAIGTDSSSSVTINGGYYYGVREALVINGTARIDGGVYEGCQHGGAYLSGSDIKVKNAIFRNVRYTGKCDWNATHYGAVYCGGSNRNAKVYLDNCRFESNVYASYGVVAKYTNTEVFLSNCVVGDNFGSDLRADSTDTIYVGNNVAYETFGNVGGTLDTTTYAGKEFGNW